MEKWQSQDTPIIIWEGYELRDCADNSTMLEGHGPVTANEREREKSGPALFYEIHCREINSLRFCPIGGVRECVCPFSLKESGCVNFGCPKK